MPKLKVVQDPEKPVAADVIAQAIVDIAAGVKRMNASRLTRKAVVALIHENSKIARSTIEIVLNNLDYLEETWLRKKT